MYILESHNLNQSRVSETICSSEDDPSFCFLGLRMTSCMFWKLFFTSLLLSCISPDFTKSLLKTCKYSQKKEKCSTDRWKPLFFLFFFPFIFISWRLITLQYCSGFCYILTWISHGFTCIPHPNSPSQLSPHPIPLGLPSAPAPSTCLMHPTWAGDLFHPW